MRGVIFILLALALVCPSWGAPLNEPGDRQAVEAVKLLQEWGLIEGYPDGSFRGERAMSRYEVAILIARALARLETQHAELASRSELAELHRLAEAFRSELEALGVRVDNLEESVARLDKRVAELGKLEWEGTLVTRVLTQSFSNQGNPRSGFGPGSLDYQTLVGTSAGANLRPHGPPGVLPVISLANGRPLTNGNSFTSAMLLNLTVTPSDDLRVLMRLFAYSSQGDSEVDAVWGVNPPYLANSFTGRAFVGPGLPVDGQSQGLGHFPFTQAGIDKVEVSYAPAQTTLTLGAFTPRLISTQVYMGQVNPQPGEPRVLESFGAHVTGDTGPFSWEAFGTRLPDGNPGVTAQYQSEALGASVRYEQDGWVAGLHFLRAANQKPADSGLTGGQVFTFVQGRPGEFYTDWVNPPGFYVNQLGNPQSPQVAGAGSVTDVRPINGLRGSDALTSRATFGPQGISMGGVNLSWEDENWSVFGDYDYSFYRPSRGAAYGVSGNLFRLGVNYRFDEGRWDLGLDYRHTDPTYDPFILTYPGTAAGQRIFRVYHRLPDFDQFWHMWSLHNTNEFPHNRKGVWARAGWQYDPDGKLTVRYSHQTQVRTSLQDVRVPAGSLGFLTPQLNVLGHSPGFFDVVFREFSPLSFDAALNPLENPRGSVNSIFAQLDHKFTGTPWLVEGLYDRYSFQRASGLAPAFGGSQNRVDLVADHLRLAVGHAFSDSVLLKLGYEQGSIRGHYDPFGVYNPYAIATGSTTFRNWDTVQHIPLAELSWQVSDGVKAGAEFRWYDNVDQVSASVFSGPPGRLGATAHPFSWSGYQIGTTLEVSF